MLLVQKFLENYTFKDLQENHGVYASFSKSGHKFSLNYDQIEAKESDPLAQECRGLILALEGGQIIPEGLTPNGPNRDYVMPGKTKILAYPMKRFFNAQQGVAAEIKWDDPSLSILEKLDGTLCIVYYDMFSKTWCVATRSVPEADLLMDNGLFTFRTLFEKAVQDSLNLSFDLFTESLVKEMTYCFELTTPYNTIVVKYPNCGITLLSVRYLPNLMEIDPKTLALVLVGNVPSAQTYSFTNVNDIIDWVSTLNPLEHEGVVVRDSNFNRIKVKNAQYVAFSKIRDTLAVSQRNCLELILGEKDDDVISILPEEIAKSLLRLKSNVQSTIKRLDLAYKSIKAEADSILPGDKKTFALLVNKTPDIWAPAMFDMFAGKVNNMKEFISRHRKDGTWANSFLDKLLELSK